MSSLIRVFKPDLIVVHIGKCGGSTVRQAIRENTDFLRRFHRVRRYHFEQPPYEFWSRYLFAVRDPVDRAVSAFNYRYHHVVVTGRERDRFPGEFESLSRYQSLSNLAELIFDGDNLNSDVVADLGKIHHLGDENFSFYLEPLLKKLRHKQIVAVLETGQLDQQIRLLMGKSVTPKRVTADKIPTDMKILSPLAQANLATFLASDIAALRELRQLHAS